MTQRLFLHQTRSFQGRLVLTQERRYFSLAKFLSQSACYVRYESEFVLKIVYLGRGHFGVMGTYSFAAVGGYAVHVSIADSGGSVAYATASVSAG